MLVLEYVWASVLKVCGGSPLAAAQAEPITQLKKGRMLPDVSDYGVDEYIFGL